MDKTEFGAFVAENRKKLALTQKELAEKLHVMDKAVSKWERGLSYPDVTLLEPLAEAFGLGVSELVSCGRTEDSPAPARWADREIPPKEEERPEKEAVQALLDISGESLRTERKRRRRTAAALAALLLLALAAVILLALGKSTVTESGAILIVRAEWQGGDRYVYVDQGAHLLQLRCGEGINWRLLGGMIGPSLWKAEYRYDRRTLRGELLNCELDFGGQAVGTPMDEVGSRTDLGAFNGDALFGYPRIMVKYLSRQPNPYGKGYLSTYVFYKGDDSDDWFLHADEELLRVGGCLGYGDLGDIGFRTVDFDGDGVTELLVRTVWPEKPCIVYDLEDGRISETWLDEMPKEMVGPME